VGLFWQDGRGVLLTSRRKDKAENIRKRNGSVGLRREKREDQLGKRDAFATLQNPAFAGL
jgi:hypothetical protein